MRQIKRPSTIRAVAVIGLPKTGDQRPSTVIRFTDSRDPFLFIDRRRFVYRLSLARALCIKARRRVKLVKRSTRVF